MPDEIFQDTYSVGQVAGIVGKHPNTIRGYAQKYGQFLSDGATPAEGEERRFTNDDLDVLITVATLKTQRKQNSFIVGALAREEYVVVDSPTEDPSKQATIEEQPETDAVTTENRALATLELLQQYAKPYMDRVTELEGKLEAERDARLDVERDAARLSGQLESVYRRHWWQVWKPDKPEDD